MITSRASSKDILIAKTTRKRYVDADIITKGTDLNGSQYYGIDTKFVRLSIYCHGHTHTLLSASSTQSCYMHTLILINEKVNIVNRF